MKSINYSINIPKKGGALWQNINKKNIQKIVKVKEREAVKNS